MLVTLLLDISVDDGRDPLLVGEYLVELVHAVVVPGEDLAVVADLLARGEASIEIAVFREVSLCVGDVHRITQHVCRQTVREIVGVAAVEPARHVVVLQLVLEE